MDIERKESTMSDIRERLEKIRQQAVQHMDEAKSADALNEIRVAVLGKKGELKDLMKGLKDVAPEDRPRVGQMVNEARDLIEAKLDEVRKRLEKEKMMRDLENEKIDVTLPAKKSRCWTSPSQPDRAGRSRADLCWYGI